MSVIATPVGPAGADAPRLALVRGLCRRPLALAAALVLAVIVVAVVVAPLIAPYNPNYTDLMHPLAGPSAHHLLGTDQLGRDLLSRLLYGGRPSLLYSAEAVAVTLLIGVPLGLIAGVVGGWVDRVLMQCVDIGMSVPVMVVVLIVIAVFTTHFFVAMIALGLLLVPPLARVVRGAAVAVRGEQYLDAARVAGVSPVRTVFRHVLPRVRGTVLVQATLLAGIALLFTTGLAYLGFGVTGTNPSWGSMTADAAQVLNQSSWPLIASGGAIGITVLCLGIVGDAIRDLSVEAWAGPAGRPRRQRVRAAATSAPAGAAPAVDPDALLSVRGLSVSFAGPRGEVGVVSEVSFDIHAGETVGLVGESGCGKTSVARALIGLLRPGGRVVGGQIMFEGRDLLSLSRAEMRQVRGAGIALVSQEPLDALDPNFRIGATLATAVRSHSTCSRAQARRRAVELLETVRLAEPERIARSYPHEISGGMAQRVCIARALASSPRLLIADEPTTALDVTLQAEILALLRTLQAETGMALLLVSHDWGVITESCARAIVMYAGEIVETAPVARIFKRPGHPYSERLLAANPALVHDDTLPLPTIPGSIVAPGHWPDGCRFAPRCAHATAICTQAPVPLLNLEPGCASRCVHARALAERHVLQMAGGER